MTVICMHYLVSHPFSNKWLGLLTPHIGGYCVFSQGIFLFLHFSLMKLLMTEILSFTTKKKPLEKLQSFLRVVEA